MCVAWNIICVCSVVYVILGTLCVMKKRTPCEETISVSMTYYRRLDGLSGLYEILISSKREFDENRHSDSHALLKGVNNICFCTVKRMIFRKLKTLWHSPSRYTPWPILPVV
jgi:hypothetical protein